MDQAGSSDRPDRFRKPSAPPRVGTRAACRLVDQDSKDQFYTMPADFPLSGFELTISYSYRLVCVPPHQSVGESNIATVYDMAAMHADKLKQENSPGYTRWRAAFQNAADGFQVSPWNPHPSACPSSPCPPCEE